MKANLRYLQRSTESVLRKRKFFELTIHDAPIEELIVYLDERIVQRFATHVIPVNPHVYQIGIEDESYFGILEQGDVVLCDGVGILLGSKVAGDPIKHRVVGTDLMMGLSGLAAHKGYSVFLLGGLNGAAHQCAKVLLKHWPGLNICGVEELPFFNNIDRLENDGTIERINRSRADILFVSLGAPKQEQWIARNRHLLESRLMMGVGASFNLIGGIVRRAPHWIRSAGFEWLFRLSQEPGRLWKRYLIGNPRFLYHVIKERFVSNKGS